MKRLVGSLLFSGVAVCAFSQAPFTIVRPPDGAKVREKVKIDIPAKSIPPGGYVGVFLNGSLIEAVVPPLVGKYYEYVLDTKARHIPDTASGQTDKLELVLYTDYDEKSRIVDRSSVNIKIGNEANIPIPAAGIKLRYRFVPGEEMIYDMTQHIQSSSLTQSEADNQDSKPAVWDTEGETVRVAYSVVNAYPNGDGLLWMQVLPTKGKDYADITPDHGTEQMRWYEPQMTPVYMRVTPTGHEVYGTIPQYFGFDGVLQASEPSQLLPLFPLPTLPQKAVHNGDEWPSRFLDGANIDPNDWMNINSIVEEIPAKGQFVGAEWERNHPCAKIQNVIEAGAEGISHGVNRPSGDKMSMTETIWFTLDTHEILKIQRDMTVDRKVQDQSNFGGGFGTGPGGPGGPPNMGRPGGGPGAPGPAGLGGGNFRGAGTVDQAGMFPGGGKGGGRFGGRGGFPGAGGPPPGLGGNFGGMNGGGVQAQQPTFVRLHLLQTFTLEK